MKDRIRLGVVSMVAKVLQLKMKILHRLSIPCWMFFGLNENHISRRGNFSIYIRFVFHVGEKKVCHVNWLLRFFGVASMFTIFFFN